MIVKPEARMYDENGHYMHGSFPLNLKNEIGTVEGEQAFFRWCAENGLSGKILEVEDQEEWVAAARTQGSPKTLVRWAPWGRIDEETFQAEGWVVFAVFEAANGWPRCILVRNIPSKEDAPESSPRPETEDPIAARWRFSSGSFIDQLRGSVPTIAQSAAMKNMRIFVEGLYGAIKTNVPESKEKEECLRSLTVLNFWANAGICRYPLDDVRYAGAAYTETEDGIRANHVAILKEDPYSFRFHHDRPNLSNPPKREGEHNLNPEDIKALMSAGVQFGMSVDGLAPIIPEGTKDEKSPLDPKVEDLAIEVSLDFVRAEGKMPGDERGTLIYSLIRKYARIFGIRGPA